MPVYFVTGTNRSKGIGFQMVCQLLSAPSNTVLASARSPENSTCLTDLAASNPRLKLIKLDVASPSSIKSLSAQLEKHAPTGIDVYIHNAAVGFSYHEVLESTYDEMEQHLKVNTIGPIMTFQVVYPYLKMRETKKAVFISSFGGSCELSFPIMAAYGASKAGLNRMLVSLASELKDQGIIVGIVYPGAVLTDMFDVLRASAAVREEVASGLRAVDDMTITPEKSAENVLKIVERLTLDDSGKFIDSWKDGAIIPW